VSLKSKAIDLNTLLIWSNLLFVGLLLGSYQTNGSGAYVDGQTVVLGVILATETCCALWIERRRRDPFVILLAFTMTFYFLLRLSTLTLFEYSEVFDRFPYDAQDSNRALVFIIVANLFLYLGLAAGGRVSPRVEPGEWRVTHRRRVLFVLLAAIALSYVNGGLWGQDNIPRALSFLSLYLAPSVLVLMTLGYYFIFRASLPARFGVYVACLLIGEVMAHMLFGGRGAVVDLIQNCMLAVLAIAGSIKLRRRMVAIGVAMLPVVIVLLVVAFLASTYIRAARTATGAPSLTQGFTLAQESRDRISGAQALDVLLAPVASRAGFFDYSAEIIAHAQQYAGVINPGAYFRSIVDNILTPGFDVYDQPKTANALEFVYQQAGTPSKIAAEQFYQSDQLGIYGEFYVLFGAILAMPVMAFLAWSLKSLYVRIRIENPFTRGMSRIIVLFLFARIINSFGLDWVIGETLPLVAALFIYRYFFAVRRPVRRSTTSPSAYSAGAAVS
jgi:hypothetical protein